MKILSQHAYLVLALGFAISLRLHAQQQNQLTLEKLSLQIKIANEKIEQIRAENNQLKLRLEVLEKNIEPKRDSSVTTLTGSVSLKRNNGETLAVSRNKVKVISKTKAEKILSSYEQYAPLIAQGQALLSTNASIDSKMQFIQTLDQLINLIDLQASEPISEINTDFEGNFSTNNISEGTYYVLTSFSTDLVSAFWIERIVINQGGKLNIALTEKNAKYILQVR